MSLSFQMNSNAPTQFDKKRQEVIGSGLFKALCNLYSKSSCFSSFMQNRFSITIGFINKVLMWSYVGKKTSFVLMPTFIVVLATKSIYNPTEHCLNQERAL